jgi:hypothetical protein
MLFGMGDGHDIGTWCSTQHAAQAPLSNATVIWSHTLFQQAAARVREGPDPGTGTMGLPS